MRKLLDYEELNKKLDQIKGDYFFEHMPIDTTEFGYPIRYFTYGRGPYHVILTAGTHSVELITTHFLIHIMEKLVTHEFLDPELYTIHLLPMLNPEGNIIVTSAIRSLITRETTEQEEQLYCIQYFANSKLEDIYSQKHDDQGIKLQNWMFRYADENCIDAKHDRLKKQVKRIIHTYNLPRGALIHWSSNGSGIDLNANVETGRYMKETQAGIPVWKNGGMNTINRTTPGPVGCPMRKGTFQYEKENDALLTFYKAVAEQYKVIGGFIYHSCGNEVWYLDQIAGQPNPWKKITSKEYKGNKDIAKFFQKQTGATLYKNKDYYTMNTYLQTIVPNTLLVEMGPIRATPLSQFIDQSVGYIDYPIYTTTIETQTKALKNTIEQMLETYQQRK